MLYPNKIYKRIYNVPLLELWNMGIRGLILDIDNTLTIHNSPDIDTLTSAWLEDAKKQGFKLIILSNNTKERAEPFANKLNLPFISKGRKPLLSGAKKCQKALGVKREEIAFIGDQLFTDVLCAKRFGSFAIMLEPIEPESFFFFRLKRKLEKYFLKKHKIEMETK